ncbi:hypothetical protein Hanom_Chr04g00359591 [Helianthus anomalus]
MWKQDFGKFFEAHSNCNSSPVSYEELKNENLQLQNKFSVSYEELKNENLQLQNKLLLEENKMLKRQICAKEYMWKQPFVFSLFFVIAIWMYMLK